MTGDWGGSRIQVQIIPHRLNRGNVGCNYDVINDWDWDWDLGLGGFPITREMTDNSFKDLKR